jgi:YidC/Oxa1 family membrane protein insertase
MDRTSVIVIAACILLIFLWEPMVVRKLYPAKPLPAGQTNLVAQPDPSTSRWAQPTEPSQIATPAPTPYPTAPAHTAPAPAINTNIAEQLIVLETDDAKYTFTSHGGGLKTVQVYKNGTNVLNANARVPAMAILGGESIEGDGIYKLSRRHDTVRAEKDLPNGLFIIKEFTPGSNYLVNTRVRMENRSKEPLILPTQHWITGTATPLTPKDDGSTVGVMWYNGDDSKNINAGWFANRTLGCIPGTPRYHYLEGQSNVFWAAAYNQFFAMAVMVNEPAQQIAINKINLPPPTPEQLKVDSRLTRAPEGFEAAMIYPATILAPGANIERELSIFAGPKEYRTLATIAAGARNNIDAIMSFGGFFGFFSKGLLLGMNWLHDNLKLSYGWAIVVITIIIKMLFWPLTRASTRSMKRMAALQPQMKEIQLKYKDDPAKMNRKTMEFMKEHKVSPLGGCLPMILQMPVFIGFFYMIRSAIELRGEPFLWVRDLSTPDTLFTIPGIDFPFNLLPLIMGATMLWQARLTPPAPGMDPMQAKMMRYLPLIFIVILYNFSAGLTLYWTVQNLLTILQTKLTKEKPAATPAVPVPTKPAKAAPVKPRKQKSAERK